MKKRTIANIFYLLFFLIQVVAEGIAVYVLLKLDLLPDKLLYVVFGVLGFFLILTACLLFIRIKGRTKEERRERRKKPITKTSVIGVILSIVFSFVSLVGCYAAQRLEKTINTITARVEISDVIGVYVRQDDAAQTLQDASGYVFGTNSAYDMENSQKTLAAINQELGEGVQSTEYANPFIMVDALYNGEVQAIILNQAYLGVLRQDDEYEHIEDEIRLIYEHNITREVEIDQAAAEDENGKAAVQPEPDIEATEPVEDVTQEPFVMYLSGSDTRNSMLSTSRSDVNILVVINPASREVLLINTPRDYYVQISIGGGSYDKLTHCGIYGIDCSIDTLAALYGVKVNYYGQINFTGFETLIDAVGGITVYSEQAFEADDGSYFTEGDNLLDGERALAFARERHAFSDGDNARGRNQMKIISAVIKKATSSSAIVTNYDQILASLEGMFITDISSDEISNLVKMHLAQGGTWNVHSFAVTGFNGSDVTYSMPGRNTYVMYQNEESVNKAKTLISRVLNGENLEDYDVTPVE